MAPRSLTWAKPFRATMDSALPSPASRAGKTCSLAAPKDTARLSTSRTRPARASGVTGKASMPIPRSFRIRLTSPSSQAAAPLPLPLA